jgi:16S rRNA (guanine527-N7)-methyltransferase
MKEFLNCIQEMGISLSAEQLEKFSEFESILLEYNEKMNLTRITEHSEIAVKHFADSAAVIPFLKKHLSEDLKIQAADVGTGAGFPGIPLKIMLPQLNMTLLDSLKKRISFLDEVIERLGMDAIKTKHIRAEDAGKAPELRESFDLVIARAVARMPVLSEYCLPLVKTGGILAAMKAGCGDELDESKFAIQLLGGRIEEVYEYGINNNEISRTLILVRKISDTPKTYPRKAGKAMAEPLMDKRSIK